MERLYAIRVGPSSVEAWSVARLPFEPIGWALAFRDDLRDALRQTSPVAGARLHAIYGADDQGQFVDTENVLLYNVGSAALRHLMSHGVGFERSFRYPSPPRNSGLPEKGLHYHRYDFVETPVFENWRAADLLASFGPVTVSSLAKPGPIWAAVRRQAAPPSRAPGTAVRFVVELTIGDAQGNSSSSIANQVKPALDGVISAYHAHLGDTEVPSERLASMGLGEKIELQRLLGDTAWNTLGSRTVVRPFGVAGVQWNPADDFCVAATVQSTTVDTVPAGHRWRLAGKIATAEPI
jgi:hypothetical protein